MKKIITKNDLCIYWCLWNLKEMTEQEFVKLSGKDTSKFFNEHRADCLKEWGRCMKARAELLKNKKKFLTKEGYCICPVMQKIPNATRTKTKTPVALWICKLHGQCFANILDEK